MNWHISENLSFEEAMTLTETLLEGMETKTLKKNEIQDFITQLVNSQNGARGFFVTYLTSEKKLADTPEEEVINALKTSPEIVSELLVKNLAMSSAMAITHRRNNDENAALGSQKVSQRTAKLIQQVELDLVKEKLGKLQETIMTGKGDYTTFLERWGYDEEQKTVIQNQVKTLL